MWQHADWNETLAVAAKFGADVKPASGYNAETVLALITLSQGAALLKHEHLRAAAKRTALLAGGVALIVFVLFFVQALWH